MAPTYVTDNLLNFPKHSFCLTKWSEHAPTNAGKELHTTERSQGSSRSEKSFLDFDYLVGLDIAHTAYPFDFILQGVISRKVARRWHS